MIKVLLHLSHNVSLGQQTKKLTSFENESKF